MVRYTASKPPSVVNPEWIFWSKSDFKQGLAPDDVSSVIFITRKKEVSVIYKPTPVINERDELISIIGNMFDKSSSPAFLKLIKMKSDRAMQSSSTPRSPPSFVLKSPSKSTRSRKRIGMMHRWKSHSSQSPPSL